VRFAVLALSLLLACAASSASADEEFPFPELQTEVYCKTLVEKMLDENERATEHTRCLAQEAFLKGQLEPWWPFLDPRTQRMIVKSHYREPKYQTYITLLQYTASAIGDACLSRRIECKNPKAR
jgi:hypothetical protein